MVVENLRILDLENKGVLLQAPLPLMGSPFDSSNGKNAADKSQWWRCCVSIASWLGQEYAVQSEWHDQSGEHPDPRFRADTPSLVLEPRQFKKYISRHVDVCASGFSKVIVAPK